LASSSVLKKRKRNIKKVNKILKNNNLKKPEKMIFLNSTKSPDIACSINFRGRYAVTPMLFRSSSDSVVNMARSTSFARNSSNFKAI
jgi:hypothetical protein